MSDLADLSEQDKDRLIELADAPAAYGRPMDWIADWRELRRRKLVETGEVRTMRRYTFGAGHEVIDGRENLEPVHQVRLTEAGWAAVHEIGKERGFPGVDVKIKIHQEPIDE